MNEGRIIEDDEIKMKLLKRPYKQWLATRIYCRLAQIPYTDNLIPVENIDFETRQHFFGYTLEDLKTLLSIVGAEGWFYGK
jgi:glutamate synthase (ferredoxin)